LFGQETRPHLQLLGRRRLVEEKLKVVIAKIDFVGDDGHWKGLNFQFLLHFRLVSTQYLATYFTFVFNYDRIANGAFFFQTVTCDDVSSIHGTA